MKNEYLILKNKIIKFNPEYLYYVHSHNHYEIIYIIAGQCIMSVSNQDIALNQGNCIVINRYSSHNFYVNGEKGCKINQLEVSIDKDIIDSDFVKLKNAHIVAESLNNILFFQTQIENEKDKERLIALEIEKITILANSLKSSDTCDDKNVKKAVEIIRTNYNYDIDCSKLARDIGISDRYLRRIFEKTLGMTPKEYISNLKIEKAKVLLIHSDKAVAEIAIEVGYNTIQYFSEVFKRHIGITPCEFRAYNKHSAEEGK